MSYKISVDRCDQYNKDLSYRDVPLVEFMYFVKKLVCQVRVNAIGNSGLCCVCVTH